MLKIYFTASTSFDGEYLKNYRTILNLLKKTNSKILSGEQIVKRSLLKKDQKLPEEMIFKRERRLIDEADLVVADVTKPSIGVGGQIVYALMREKPVLALVYKENEDRLSPMIAGNPSDNLFLEHFDLDNLHLILKNFLHYIRQLKKKKGRLIVIDGGDGSGKTTQAKLLIKHLKSNKYLTKYLDFPRYYTSFHGQMVAKFLRGEFGSLNKVSPYLASLAYALDRASVKEEMDEYLLKGGYIVANRYATSNMAHQGAKLDSEKERRDFLNWIFELEYKIHKIPKEDVVVYLHVPYQMALKLTSNKGVRKYLKGKKNDIQENDTGYRKKTEEMYLHLAQKHKHWIKINCVKEDKILSRKMIHQKIIEGLRKKKIINT